jgi:hypothetical protein
MSRRWAGTAITLCTIAFSSALPSAASAQDATPVIPSDLDLATAGAVVSNPYFPLASVRVKIYEGEITDQDTGETVLDRVEERVLPESVTIDGIEATAVDVNEYADGELIEHSLDYYAQDAAGTVYYLGEDVDMYENGKVASHEGSWRAGEGENQAGLFMPAEPAAGQQFEQERAPGVAEDRSTVVAVDQTVTVAAGTFAGCIRTEDVNPLEDATEYKLYCPGIGVVREEDVEGAVDLISFAGGSVATS